MESFDPMPDSPRSRHAVGASRPTARGFPGAIGSVCALAMLIASSVGCIPLGKTNAPMTEVEGRRSLDGDFRKNLRAAPRSDTNFLTYAELASLVRNPQPDGALGKKLDQFWKTPVVSNHMWESGDHPQRAHNRHMGEFLRVGTWNIEKSLHLREVADALTSEQDYRAMMKPEGLLTPDQDKMLRQRERLASADVLIFQEMDIGVDRSGYLDSARFLGEKLGMNYAYAPMQLELNPVIMAMAADDPESVIDTARYRGVFGMVVLSKYPIKSAVCFQLDHQPHDWFQREVEDYDAVEHLRRAGSQGIFDTPIDREVKVGGRIFFRVDLEVPGLPDDTLSIIPVHLEIRAQPEDRRRQLAEILSHIKHIDHPVVLAGDFNSSRYDLSPTSLPRVIFRGSRDPGVWLFTLSNLLIPAQAFYNTSRTILNEAKNLYNPLAFHHSIFWPNKTALMFEDLKHHRFHDGTRFDFRGHPQRSINRSDDMLANSNEKMLKGYRTTYQVNRPIWPYGDHRLDWMFVKSSFYRDDSDSYRLAPHFGETLIAFTEALAKPLSDHRPCVVDLPLQDVMLGREE